MHATASSQHIFLERGSDHQCCVFESKLDWTELKPEISRRLQMVAMMREMPKNTYFLPWQKAGHVAPVAGSFGVVRLGGGHSR